MAIKWTYDTPFGKGEYKMKGNVLSAKKPNGSYEVIDGWTKEQLFQDKTWVAVYLAAKKEQEK